MKRILGSLVGMLVTVGAHAALPGDAVEGKRLHEASCTGCHDTSVYSRTDHKVRSLDALKAQVVNCTHMAEKDFSDKERQDIVKYLNDRFYRFK